MSSHGETFFTAVGCMDGRVQAPIAEFGQRRFNVEYPDTITEAGIVGILATTDTVDKEFLERTRFKIIDVSLGKHHSQGIVVHGHQECAGNPVEDDLHREHVREAARRIQSWLPENNQIPVVAVFVSRDHTSNRWVVEEL